MLFRSNDVNLATVDKAVIIGFNVRPNRQVADLADREGVEIKYYSIIYKAIEDIEAALKGMLKPEYEEVVTSHSEIREIFRSSKFGNIAGVMVQDGEVKRGTKCRILRNGVATVNDLEISSLRRFKDDVQSVKEGYEAGINLGTFNDIELGDIIETGAQADIKPGNNLPLKNIKHILDTAGTGIEHVCRATIYQIGRASCRERV